jgi:hypothetical protein
VLWDITPCRPLKVNRGFWGTYHLHLQCWRANKPRNQQEAGGKQQTTGVISQNTELSITNFLRTSNPTIYTHLIVACTYLTGIVKISISISISENAAVKSSLSEMWLRYWHAALAASVCPSAIVSCSRFFCCLSQYDLNYLTQAFIYKLNFNVTFCGWWWWWW